MCSLDRSRRALLRWRRLRPGFGRWWWGSGILCAGRWGSGRWLRGKIGRQRGNGRWCLCLLRGRRWWRLLPGDNRGFLREDVLKDRKEIENRRLLQSSVNITFLLSRNVNLSLHPKRSTSRRDKGGRLGPAGQHVDPGAPSSCRSVSRRRAGAPEGRHGAPILRRGNDMSRRGRGLVWCQRDAQAVPSFHWGKLHRQQKQTHLLAHCWIEMHHGGQAQGNEWGLHTVDVGPGRERRVLGKPLGHIVVGSVDVVVFLEQGEEWLAND